MTGLQELRVILAVTFMMLIFGMILFWPQDDPEPFTPQQNWDLEILYDPPTTTAPECHPVQQELGQCPLVPAVLR